MPQVLLINPISRKEVKAMAKKKRTPAQQRATKKMIAANRARAKGTTRKARSAPRKARVSRGKTRRPNRPNRESNPAPALKKRRRRITSKADATRAGRMLRRRRRNPIGLGGFVKTTLVPSAVGGAGALALDLLLNVIPIPVAVKNGPMRPLLKIGGAIGLGMVASKVASRRVGEQVAAGALTVALYDMAKAAIAKSPAGKWFGLAGYELDMGAYIGEDVGAYVDDGTGQQMLGYTDAGMQVGDYTADGSVEGYETGLYR